MSFNISSASLRSILKLTEKRESLADALAKIEAQIAQALGQTTKIAGHVVGNGRQAPRTASISKSAKRAKRGAARESILAGLKEAGEKGIAVKDLAAKIGIKAQNIHVWLHTTGKKNGACRGSGQRHLSLKAVKYAPHPSQRCQSPSGKEDREKGQQACGTKKEIIGYFFSKAPEHTGW